MYKGIQVEFSNLKTTEGRNGLVIQADIKYKGKKIATYFDEGNGGKVDIDVIGSLTGANGKYQKSQNYINNQTLLEQLYAEFAALPKVKSAFTNEQGVHHFFDECIEFAMDEFINEREKLKIAKKGLLFEDAEGVERVASWKGGGIPALLKKFSAERFVPIIEKQIVEIQNKGGKVLLQNYYISIGVNPEIFKTKTA